MKLAIIFVGQTVDLHNLHKFLPDYKLTGFTKTPDHDKVVIQVDPGEQHRLLQCASFLKLYNYTIKSIVVQDDAQLDYRALLYQLQCFDIKNIIIDRGQLSDDSFMQLITKELTFISPVVEFVAPYIPLHVAPIILDHKSPVVTQLIPPTPLHPPVGEKKDNPDRSKQRHGRKTHEGHLIGQYLQPTPMLFSRDGHNIWLGDMYRGDSAFLILGGPSFAGVDHSKLNKAGILTMGVNNSVKSYRPNLWISVDDPTHFMKSIWLDPKITKFVPYSHSEKKIFDNVAWKELNTMVGDCPNVLFYKRNEHFLTDQFLFEDTVNWGNHKEFGGGRSVMLAAIRILFYLGIRNIYLLGCDFKMDDKTKYHFEQDRTESSIKGNSSTYKLLIERFAQLKPVFEANGLYIHNCNPDSELKVFPFIEFDKAIEAASTKMPIDLANERTAGLYERLADMKKQKQNNAK